MYDSYLDEKSDFYGLDGSLVQCLVNEEPSSSDYCFCVETIGGKRIILISAPTTAQVLIELIRAKERGVTKADVFDTTKCLVSQIKQLKKYGLKIRSIGGARQHGYDNRYILEDKVRLRKRYE